MNNKNVFSFFCQRDIDDIYKTIEPYMPAYGIKDLQQSIIYESDKKIICRSIKNEKKETIGNEILVQLYKTNEIYKVRQLENYIKLEKRDFRKVEKIVVSLDNNIIKRKFYYRTGEKVYSLEEEYELESKNSFYNYINSSNIEETMKDLKSKNIVKKRT